MTRPEEIDYARARGIPVPAATESPYSIDANLWGRSIECGVLDDPWTEPPEDVYTLTKSRCGVPRRAGLRRDRVRARRPDGDQRRRDAAASS